MVRVRKVVDDNNIAAIALASALKFQVNQSNKLCYQNIGLWMLISFICCLN